jgi:ubiquinone/menaquinone biosynthesis C-methylase UbiE
MSQAREQIETEAYKNFIVKMLEKDQDEFCPMRREKQMEYLFTMLAKDFEAKGRRVLDACCGYGRLIHFLNEYDPAQEYVGIDYVPSLISKARERFAGWSNIRFEERDVMKLAEYYGKEFSIAINYKTISWLSYYETLVEQLIKVTRDKIYITSLFYDGPFDFIAKIHDYSQPESDSYNYLNTYSFPKFERFCKALGVKEVNAIDMRLDFDLPKPSDPGVLQTYTVLAADGSRLEMTGVIGLNWKLIQLVL